MQRKELLNYQNNIAIVASNALIVFCIQGRVGMQAERTGNSLRIGSKHRGLIAFDKIQYGR